MKRLSLTLAASSVFLTSLGFPALAQEAPKTETEKLSYVLGMDVGLSLKRIGTEIDLDAFMQALGHVLNDQETLITTQEATQIKQAFVQVQREKQETKAKASAEKNLAEGEAFLAKNKTEEGVVTTDSGLQYRVLEEGSGPKPAATDKVSVHYRGTLLDGTEFDSSYQRGQPATFPLNGVIPGWTEGLQLMPVGGKYKFFIPAQLAYGEKGAGDRIGPNATLIFEVELLEIAQ